MWIDVVDVLDKNQHLGQQQITIARIFTKNRNQFTFTLEFALSIILMILIQLKYHVTKFTFMDKK